MELAIDRLTKQYKNKIAVDRVSIKLKPGVYGLLGANGAGKTRKDRCVGGPLWSRKNNTYENDMWYSKSNFWSN